MSRCTDPSRRRGRHCLPAAATAILLASLASAHAQEVPATPMPTQEPAPVLAMPAQEPAPALAVPAGLPDRTVPLLGRDADLTGSADELAIPFNLPPDEPFDRATLALGYSNALAVLPDRSQLTLSLNGRHLANLPLVGAQSPAGAEIDLPASAFAGGRNELRVQLRQAHRLACSRERFAELWTKLKADGTRLALHRSGERPPLEPGGLTGLLAASTYDGERFAVATGPSLAGPSGIELGARVAQAVALTRGDRALSVDALALGELDWQEMRGRNFALVGSTEELAPLLDPAELAAIEGGRMLVRRLPADPDHVAILFAGADTAAIERAVASFVGIAARPLDPPPLPEIQGGSELELSRVGFTDHELPLGATRPVSIRFRLPPSFYAADGQRLELVLNYAYAAGLAATSALVVQVNGIAANMIRLDDPRGQIVDGARLNLTLGMFHPGINTIAIHPILEPASEQACAETGPVLSLFADGRIVMPEFARLAHGGDLQDLIDDGFPYGQEPADVMVSGRDPRTVGAAWTLLGKLAQRRGEMLDKLTFVPPGSTPTSHLIAVGTEDDLSPSLVAKLDLPWQAPDDPTPVAAATASTPIAASLPDPRDRWKSRIEDANSALPWFERVRQMIISAADADVTAAVPERPPAPAAPQAGGAMLVEVASPWAPQRVTTVLVADQADHLAPGVDKLIDVAVWDGLRGDRAQWRAGPDDVIDERRNPPFVLGAPESDPGQWRLTMLTWLAQNRWAWLALMLAALGSASLMTSLVLRMRRH